MNVLWTLILYLASVYKCLLYGIEWSVNVNMSFDQNKYDMQYKKEHYDRITALIDKQLDIKNRLKLLSIGLNKSVNQLLIEAVNDLLEKYNAWKHITIA